MLFIVNVVVAIAKWCDAKVEVSIFTGYLTFHIILNFDIFPSDMSPQDVTLLEINNKNNIWCVKKEHWQQQAFIIVIVPRFNAELKCPCIQ